jgi:nicotinamidase-related amidase
MFALITNIAGTMYAGEGNIVEEWSMVKAPPAPKLENVYIEPATTALLILDIEQKTVLSKPRAVAALPKIKKLLEWSRKNSISVAYSTIKISDPAQILPEVKQNDGEPVVKAGVDKFYETELEKYLKDKNIKTVIITGTAAEGAVLGTMIGAVTRGFKVILPVDCMPSSQAYAEQYVVWHAMNAPVVKGNVTVTSTELISTAK